MCAVRISFKLALTTMMLLALLTGSAWPPATNALAHGGFSGTIPIFNPPRTAPTVDGVCNVAEYTNALTLAISYRPSANYPDANARVLKIGGNLYVCVSGLGISVNPPDPHPYLAVYFDVAHTSATGRYPQSDDLRFILPLSGSSSAQRGNGSAYINAPDITAWEVVRDPTPFSSWSAEFRISSSLLGAGNPGTSIGFHVRYHDVRFAGDDFFWPPNSQFTNPTTWADLFWGRLPQLVRLDVMRITQGMNFDIGGLADYNLIANKDTLLRVQLYTETGPQQFRNAICRFVRQAERNSSGAYVTLPSSPVSILNADPNPIPYLNIQPIGYLNGSTAVDCWIPGRMVRQPGVYAFDIDIYWPGVEYPYRLFLGTREFYQSSDLRLFIKRHVNPHIPDTRNWGNDLDANILPSLQQMDRMNPLESGVWTIFLNGAEGMENLTGLRYYTSPIIYTCPLTITNAACDALSRSETDRAVSTINASLRDLDQHDGRVRDRVDWGIVLVASTGVDQGGQDCHAPERSASTGFSAGIHGPSGSMICHELNHCMGQVKSGSLHSDGHGHSTVSRIPYFSGDYMVNIHERRDYRDFYSLMYPLVGDPFETIQEGWEWNDLRSTLLTMDRPSMPSIEPSGGWIATPENTPLFQVSGILDLNPVITVTHSARVDDLPLDVMLPDPGGAYTLNFLDDSYKTLSAFSFNPAFEGIDGGISPVTDLYLVTPLPEGSARFEIRKGVTLLYGKDFSPNSPSVSNLNLSAVADGFDLSWDSDDPDSDPLEFSVFFFTADDQPPILIAQGLTASAFHFDATYAGGSSTARLLVQASDGYNLSNMEATSEFTIPDQDPLAVIEYPPTETELTEGRPVTLVGSGYDYTTGPIADEGMKWSSNVDGDLGVGSRLEVKLSEGDHTLTLRVEAPTGKHTTAQTLVTVRPDGDGDGLSDLYENTFACLSSSKFDSLDDPDADNLPNLAEQLHATNPCDSDTDWDGVSDGDEAWANTNPNDSGSLPPPDQIFLRPDAIQLDCFTGELTGDIEVQTSNEQISWSAVSDSGWLTVDGDGTGDGQIAITGICSGLPYGLYTGRVSVVAGSQYRYVPVELSLPAKVYLPVIQQSK